MNIRETARKKKEELSQPTDVGPSIPPDFEEGYLVGFRDAIAQFKHMVSCVHINDEPIVEPPMAPPPETI
jgi:hypothetical protein